MAQAIDLGQLLQIIKKRLWLIMALVILASISGMIINNYVITPIYEARTQVLVNLKNSEEPYSWTQMETELQLINTYNVIMTTPLVLDQVIRQLDLSLTDKQLASKIEIKTESESKVINIIVQDEKYEKAVAIANKVAEVFQKEIRNIMDVDNITILSAATIRDQPAPVTPNKAINMSIALLIGLALGLAITFLLEAMDKTVKTEKDVEEILDLPVMGLVGVINIETKTKKLRRKPRVS